MNCVNIIWNDKIKKNDYIDKIKVLKEKRGARLGQVNYSNPLVRLSLVPQWNEKNKSFFFFFLRMNEVGENESGPEEALGEKSSFRSKLFQYYASLANIHLTSIVEVLDNITVVIF